MGVRALTQMLLAVLEQTIFDRAEPLELRLFPCIGFAFGSFVHPCSRSDKPLASPAKLPLTATRSLHDQISDFKLLEAPCPNNSSSLRTSCLFLAKILQ